MIRDFRFFLRHCVEILHFVRGIMLMLAFILLMGAAVFVVAEGMTVGDALYLTLISSLTIGYGDITPATAVGRLASVVIGIVGVVYMGLVVAVATRALAVSVAEKQGGEDGENDRK